MSRHTPPRRPAGSLNPPPAADPMAKSAEQIQAADALRRADGNDQNKLDQEKGDDVVVLHEETDRFYYEGDEPPQADAMRTLFLQLAVIDQQLQDEGHSLAGLLSKLAGSQFGVYPTFDVPAEDNEA